MKKILTFIVLVLRHADLCPRRGERVDYGDKGHPVVFRAFRRGAVAT